jgi:hypothetical protein
MRYEIGDDIKSNQMKSREVERWEGYEGNEGQRKASKDIQNKQQIGIQRG